ncbi:MAG: hypothetical protein AAGA57_02235 [Planctomycetota bacterium]
MLASEPVSAGILETTGNIDVVAPPATVAYQQNESAERGIVFPERVAITEGFKFDLGPVIGVYDEASDLAGLDSFTSGDPPVNSYFFHADTTFGVVAVNGTIRFDEPIFAIALSEVRLSQTDGLAGAPATTYSPFTPRGLEFDFGDQIEIIDAYTIGLAIASSNGLDQVRIFTLPEPVSATALAPLVCVVGRRRRAG